MHEPGGEASRNYHDRSLARGLRTPAQLAVDEHVYPGAVQNLGAGQHLEVRRENLCDFRGNEKRRGGSAVHVHFVEGLTVGTVDPDQDRGKQAGDARGGHQHIAKQHPRGLATVCGNRPHVPDHGLLFIQVGRRYEQHLAARSLSGNGLDEPAAHQVVDQLYERLAPIGAGSKQHAKPARLQETGGPVGAQGFDHSLVPLRAQERKRGDQRADADSRDDLELRTISAAREADERAGTERASGPAARERKNVECLATGRLAEAAQLLSRMGQHEAAVQAEEAHGLWES